MHDQNGEEDSRKLAEVALYAPVIRTHSVIAIVPSNHMHPLYLIPVCANIASPGHEMSNFLSTSHTKLLKRGTTDKENDEMEKEEDI